MACEHKAHAINVGPTIVTMDLTGGWDSLGGDVDAGTGLFGLVGCAVVQMTDPAGIGGQIMATVFATPDEAEAYFQFLDNTYIAEEMAKYGADGGFDIAAQAGQFLASLADGVWAQDPDDVWPDDPDEA